MVGAGAWFPSVLMLAVSIVESCLDHVDCVQPRHLYVLRSEPPSRGYLGLVSVSCEAHRSSNAMRTQSVAARAILGIERNASRYRIMSNSPMDRLPASSSQRGLGAHQHIAPTGGTKGNHERIYCYRSALSAAAHCFQLSCAGLDKHIRPPVINPAFLLASFMLLCQTRPSS